MILIHVFKNERGMTLLEILCSMMILSIILLCFMTFFLSSAKYNGISFEKLKATNIAREVQEELKVDSDKNDDLLDLILFSKTSPDTTIPYLSYPKLELTKDIQLSNGILTLTLHKQNFTVEVLIDTNDDPNVTIPLSRLQVQVKKDATLLSETFTYINNLKGR
jgi:prepilin-type N-terminal cleavage/methylation domain-containing protein